MGISRFSKRATLVAGCVALVAAVAAVAAPGASAAAPKFYGLEGNNLLKIQQVKKKGKKSFVATSSKPVQFTPSGTGVSLVGIDERPINGELHGIGSNSVVYRINPRTGVATGVAGPTTAPFLTVLDGTDFGVDFNPTSPGGGAIRIVSDTNYNHRVSPNTGADGLDTPDDDLNGGMNSPVVTHAAYTNSGLSTTQPVATTLHVLDSANDVLYTQNPPNDGTLTVPVSLDLDVTPDGGFDILGADKGFVASEVGDGSKLYSLDLVTGESESLGRIKDAGALDALAVQQK